jgi:hypothetical protein
MAIEVNVTYECDKCGKVDEGELNDSTRASEELPLGWAWSSEDVDLLFCADCYVEEQEEQEVA